MNVREGLKKYALMGAKVDNSLSPVIHASFASSGYCEPYEYVALSLDRDGLEAVLKDESYSGYNVTMPYKRDVMKYLDEISEEAAKLGAVNTVKRLDDGRLAGYNTDVYGFMYMADGLVEQNDKCLILGTGGASSAVRAGLSDLSAGEIINVSRDAANGTTYDNLDDHFDADVIVNTTPSGMYPDITGTPLDGAANGIGGRNALISDFTCLRSVLDIVYTPFRTRLLLDAKDAGIKTSSGISMLVAQALRSMEIWQGIELSDDERRSIIKSTERSIIRDDMNIVTIGMPGSGKSCISRRFAKFTGREFLDTDRLTVDKMGCDIETAIRERGEEYFRDVEADAVSEASLGKGCVIATGGGSILREESRIRLRSNSVVVYIRRPNEHLASKGRPITASQGVDALYEQRSVIYEGMTDITIENDREFGVGKNSYNQDLNAFVSKMIDEVDGWIEKM